MTGTQSNNSAYKAAYLSAYKAAFLAADVAKAHTENCRLGWPHTCQACKSAENVSLLAGQAWDRITKGEGRQ